MHNRQTLRTAALALAIASGCDADAPTPPAPPTPLAMGSASDGSGAPSAAPVADPFLGVVAARSAIELVAPYATRVTDVAAQVGDTVELGAPLLRLDDRPMREALAVARATLRGVEADRARASIERRAADASLSTARASHLAGVVAMAELEAAEFAAQRAGAVLNRAAIAIEEQRAGIAAQDAALRDSTLRSPIKGTVALRHVDPGAYVTTGQPLVRVISDDSVVVKFAIPAGRAGGLVPGSKLSIELPALGLTVDGEVDTISPELDPIAQMIVAQAHLLPGGPTLQPGTVCRVRPR